MTPAMLTTGPRVLFYASFPRIVVSRAGGRAFRGPWFFAASTDQLALEQNRRRHRRARGLAALLARPTGRARAVSMADCLGQTGAGNCVGGAVFRRPRPVLGAAPASFCAARATW